MTTYLTAVPAYGRDYRSQAEVLKDWEEGKDFRIECLMSRWDGAYINKQDKPENVHLQIHFNNQRKVMIIK